MIFFFQKTCHLKKNDRLKLRCKRGKTLSDKVERTSAVTRCPGRLTPLVQAYCLSEVRHQQAVDDESWCVLRVKRPLASQGGCHASSLVSRPKHSAALTLQDTGVFPSFLLKFSRESKVSWLVDDVAMT